MPRWKDLPDELDPQVREFASQLRRLVDRSGLSIAAVADRTGYSKTSWERYLNGRLLAPKGAIVALAEVTGTNPVHLTTMWELAERAWSRSEMRHDMTMEAIRISQARAALGEFGAPPPNAKGSKTARKSGSATATPGSAGPAGPAGVTPTVPPRATPSAEPEDAVSQPREGASSGAASGVNSWGVAGYRGPSQATGGPAGPVGPAGAGAAPASGSASGSGSASAPVGAQPPTPPPGPSYGEPPQAPRPGGGGKRRLTMFLAGVVGVLVVVALALYLTDGSGGKENEGGAASPSPSVSENVDLPPGVKCSGASCAGKDAESMGCSGDLVTTAKTATVGTAVVEVRYSETCGAAWGRITQAAQGDEVQVTVGTAEQTGSITEAGDTIAYTPMVAVKDAGEAKACVKTAAGQEGCTQ
ncbi:XRE family transcriptional regulator [Streptomyces sp. TRM68416]|uniref:helix-turn-helix domain-containing protein n=1 Tax=Streptomyces sp. TRM68416 TaxID=2758412 RepID=UPI001661F30C|nr:XRE family transcriptional regulator [Streptomyces sp. TRM68416]MBD0839229.1 DUF2690 domain-containing protein [Streptomyces sp. TRM68416]